MSQTQPRPRPPRLAAWLVNLFTSGEDAESILGDLHEEFLDVASKSGIVPARRWYWRQSVTAIAHLAGAAFRTAPWSVVGIVLLGFLLRWVCMATPGPLVMAILRAQRPYSNLHYGFYVWMLTYGVLIADVIQTLLIGCIVAAFAKGREMVATIALTFVAAATASLLFLTTGGPWSHFAYSWPFVIMELVNLLWIVLGGVIVREIRSALARRISRT